MMRERATGYNFSAGDVLGYGIGDMAPPAKVHSVTPTVSFSLPTPEEYSEFVRAHTYDLLILARKVQRTRTVSQLDALLYLLHMAHYEASDLLGLGIIIEQPKT
jgi:hypothetical protein